MFIIEHLHNHKHCVFCFALKPNKTNKSGLKWIWVKFEILKANKLKIWYKQKWLSHKLQMIKNIQVAKLKFKTWKIQINSNLYIAKKLAKCH